MPPNRIETQLYYLERNTSVDFCGGYAEFINNKNGMSRLVKVPLQKYKIIRCMPYQNPFIHGTIMGKKSFFTKYKYLNFLKNVKIMNFGVDYEQM